MNAREAVAGSLRLLSVRDQRRLLLAAGAQIATSLLDLAGVLLLGLVGALAVTAVQGTAAPEAVADFADRVGLGALTSTQLLGTLALTAAALLLVKSMLSTYLLRRILMFLASRQALVSARLAKALLARPLSFVQLRSSQQTSYALVQGASSAVLIVLGQAVIFAAELSLLLVLGVFLLVLDPLVTIGCIIFFALTALILQLVLGRWGARAGKGAADADIGSLDAIQEAVGAYREITVLDRRELYVDRIQRLRWQAARHLADMQFIGAVPKYVFEVSLVLGGFILAAVLFATQDTVEAVGTLALFLAAATRVMPALLRLQSATLSIRSASGMAEFTQEMAASLDYPASLPDAPSEREARPSVARPAHTGFAADVRLSQVTFTYPGASQPAIREVSLFAPHGSTLALAGTSGAGKTTLADLILGVLCPDTGDVRLGAYTPEEAIRGWPGAIGYVPQDVSLANTTIRCNVALGVPGESIDDDLVWEALDRAHLTEVVRSGREGLDTLVGERGVRLSGGQRQRLGIARALYTKPALLLLDEATSALDSETEGVISSTIAELRGSVTTIVIAHRLSTVRNVDQLVFLEAGRLVASGTFAEVRAEVPAFDRQAALMGLA